MSVEVKDGGLNWKARIDTSGLEQDAKRIEQEFQKINEKQKQAETNLRNAVGKNLQNVTRAAREEFAALSPEVQKTQTFLATLANEIRNVESAEKKLARSFQQGKITQEQYTQTSAALAGERKRIAEVIRQETMAMSENERMSRMQNGSIDQKRAKLAQMTRQWNALSEAERKNAQTGGVLQRQIRSLDREVSKLDRSMRSARGGGMVLNQVLMATAGIFTLSEGSRLIRDIIRVRGEIEQLEVAFTTMLGSKEKADQLMAEIVQIATTTPFKLTEVADATKQLLAYGFAQKEIKPELIAIGNIASGVGSTFQEVAYAYGTLKTQGRAFARDIRQFTTRGIPIVAELAKQFETTEANISKMVSAGEIGFENVQKAFQSMTGAGGMFFNLMEKQSQTVTGEVAKLQDKIQLMFNEIGKGNDGLIKSGISGVSFLVENYKEIADIIGVLITTYGSYRAGLALNSVFQKANGASALRLSRILAVVRLAQMRLNAVILANPYAIAATALGLLVSSLYFFSKEVKEAESLQTKLNRASAATNKLVDDQSAKVTQLISTLQNQNVAESVRLDAYNELKAISPDIIEGLSFEESKTKDLTKAVYDYIDSIREKARSENLMTEGVKIATERAAIEEKLIQAQQRLNTERERGAQKIFDGTARAGQTNIQRAEQEVKVIQDQLKSIAKAEKTINAEIAEGYDDSEKGINRRIEHLRSLQSSYGKTTAKYKEYEEQINEITKLLKEDKEEGEIQDKAFFEKIVKENTEGLEALDISAEDFKAQAKVYKDKIEEAKKNLELFDIKDKKTTEKPDKDKEGDDLVAARKKVLDELEKLEEKAYKKSFERGEQELANTKRKFEELRKAAKDAGMQPGVINRIDNVEESATGDIKYRVETENLKEELEKRKRIYADYEAHVRDFGIESANKRYAGELDVAKDYLSIIQSEYDKLMLIKPEERSGVEQERLKLITDELEEEKAFREQKQNELLKSLQNYEDERTLIIEEHQRKRDTLIKANKLKEAEELRKQYESNIGALNDQAAQDLSGFTKFFDNIDYMSRRTAKEGVQTLILELQRLANLPLDEGGVTDEFFKDMLGKLLNIQDNIKNEIPRALSGWAGELNNIANSLGDSNKGFTLMLKTVSELINRTAQVKTNIDAYQKAQQANNGAGDTLGMISAGAGIIGAVVGAIGAVTNAIDSMQKANLEYRRHILDLQYAQFNGELEINRLHRDRALIDAEGNENTLDSLTKQSKVLSDNAAKIESDYQRIFGEITGGVNEKTLEKINKELSTQGINKYNKLLQQIEQSVAISGTKTVKKGGVAGFFGGVETVNTYESLAGKSFEELLGYYEKGQLVGRAKELFEELRKLKEEGEDVNAKIDELNRSFANIFTGGLEWSGMADGIIAEFQGAGSQIEDILKNAILNGFKIRFLQEPLNKLIDEFAADAQSDDELTQSEISKFTQAYTALTENAKTALSQLEESTGITLSGDKPVEQVKGLPATIRREMTEASASELSGLFRGFYDLTKIGNTTAYEHMKIGQRQADSLIAIQLNTYNTVGRLDLAVLELKAINKNTKGGQSGRDLGMP